MNKIDLAKAVVNNMTSFGISSSVTTIAKATRQHSDTKAIEILIDVATFVTAWQVAGAISEPIRRKNEENIDSIVTWYKDLKH